MILSATGLGQEEPVDRAPMGGGYRVDSGHPSRHGRPAQDDPLLPSVGGFTLDSVNHRPISHAAYLSSASSARRPRGRLSTAESFIQRLYCISSTISYGLFVSRSNPSKFRMVVPRYQGGAKQIQNVPAARHNRLLCAKEAINGVKSSQRKRPISAMDSGYLTEGDKPFHFLRFDFVLFLSRLLFVPVSDGLLPKFPR